MSQTPDSMGEIGRDLARRLLDAMLRMDDETKADIRDAVDLMLWEREL